MATADDIFRVDPIIRELGEFLFTHVNREVPGGNVWVTAILDVRFDERDGFNYKIRVTRTQGEIVSLSAPTEITLQLIQLNRARPAAQDRWYGFKLEVSVAGACQVDLNYDPACIDDPDFFSS